MATTFNYRALRIAVCDAVCAATTQTPVHRLAADLAECEPSVQALEAHTDPTTAVREVLWKRWVDSCQPPASEEGHPMVSAFRLAYGDKDPVLRRELALVDCLTEVRYLEQRSLDPLFPGRRQGCAWNLMIHANRAGIELPDLTGVP